MLMSLLPDGSAQSEPANLASINGEAEISILFSADL